MQKSMENDPAHDDVIEKLRRFQEMDVLGLAKSEPYSWLGSDFFSEHDNILATVLPVFALGHYNEEVRKRAYALFAVLYLVPFRA